MIVMMITTLKKAVSMEVVEIGDKENGFNSESNSETDDEQVRWGEEQ